MSQIDNRKNLQYRLINVPYTCRLHNYNIALNCPELSDHEILLLFWRKKWSRPSYVRCAVDLHLSLCYSEDAQYSLMKEEKKLGITE